MAITALNNRTNTKFGTGLPIYSKIDHQTRYNTTRPYVDGLLECPIQRVPTFQVKVLEDIDKVDLYDANDNFITAFTIGGDETFEFIKRPMSDGDYLIICPDTPKIVSLEGVYDVRLGLLSDGGGVYRYFSDQFRRKANPCTLNNPNIP